MPYEVAKTRAALAAALWMDEPETAVSEARMALAVFDALGAVRDGDALAWRLRGWRVKVGRPGRKGSVLLTRRESEVLDEVAAGRSNPEIAERLYISRRTVEHHVAGILSKLGLRNRAEIAAFAVTHPEATTSPRK